MHRHPVPDSLIYRFIGGFPECGINPHVRKDTGIMEDVYGEAIILVSPLHCPLIAEHCTVEPHLLGSPPLASMPEEIDRPFRCLVELGEGCCEIIEPERECGYDYVVGSDIPAEDDLLPFHLDTRVIVMPCLLHPL